MGSGTLVITQVDLNSQGSNNPFSFKEQVQVPFSLRRYEKNVISLLNTPSTATSDTGTVVFKTNDQQHKQWTINIWAGNPAGKIQICVFVQDGNKECNNLSITFPETALNKSASARLLVGNIGVGDLLVNSIKTNTTGGGDQVFEVNSPQAAPFTLKSQSEVELSANYKPVKAGQDKGTLTVESDDPDNPKMEIKLAGGQFPDIDIAPSVLAFGKIDIGKSAELAITISNSGRADLIIDKVQLQQNSSDEFSIPALESSLPYTIAPQNSKDFMVRYESKYATANKMATLEISSNDPDLSENPYLINVSAQSEVNLPPVANITVPNDVIYGYDLQTPTDIMLDGSKSSDREGSPLTYKWEMIKKPLGSKSDLASTDKVSTTFKADQWGSYTIGLIVFDNYKQASGQATKSLSINQ